MVAMKICIYSFASSSYFFSKVVNKACYSDPSIEWSVVLPRWHHVDQFKSLLPESHVLYLYHRYEHFYNSFNISNAGHLTFGLDVDSEFLCLLKDKDGYRHLNSGEQVRRALVIAKIYFDFLSRVKPQFMLFPDVESVEGFVLLSVCKQLGIKIIYFVGMRILGGGFFSDSPSEALPSYYGSYTDDDVLMAQRFIFSYLNNKDKTEQINNNTVSCMCPTKPLWRRAPKSLILHYRYERMYVGEDNWKNRILANYSGQYKRFRYHYFRAFQLKYFEIKTLFHLPPCKYILYALQYTPESSINGIEPFYVDQMRSIDLLLHGLPSGYRLLVKEHPAMVGVRSSQFYRDLQKKPGVMLVSPFVCTRLLIQNSVLVATVTGTIALESYLLGKTSILLGKSFFQHLSYLVDGPRSFTPSIVNSLEKLPTTPLGDRIVEISKLYNIRRPISLSDPQVDSSVLTSQNLANFYSALFEHIDRISSKDSSACH
jgi:hypothetical protein